MKGHGRLVTITENDTTFVVSGWKAGQLCRDADKRPIYSASAGGWILDSRHLADVLALAQLCRIEVTIRSAGNAA